VLLLDVLHGSLLLVGILEWLLSYFFVGVSTLLFFVMW
jgi:hypothetical protein